METNKTTLYNSIEQDVCDPNMNWDDIIHHIEDLNNDNTIIESPCL